jgi:hypothetical protein
MGNEATKPEEGQRSSAHTSRVSHVPDFKGSQATALLEVIREVNSEKARAPLLSARDSPQCDE